MPYAYLCTAKQHLRGPMGNDALAAKVAALKETWLPVSLQHNQVEVEEELVLRPTQKVDIFSPVKGLFEGFKQQLKHHSSKAFTTAYNTTSLRACYHIIYDYIV